MAIYHLSGSIISRSQGRSAVACAAYRSGERLQDNRYAKTHDYTQKNDIVFSEILLPENAHEWMANRETLWNGVEDFEKRKDAQLAREIQVSLPRELTLEQNINLIKEYVQKEFVDKGMIADIAVHCDKTPDGKEQPHAHVMLTMREITADGFGQKVREWNAKENLLVWRESWAETTNRHLTFNGHDISIDHRSNAERGIELEPQYKIGTAVAQDKMARLLDHQRIAFENGERIYEKPKAALEALTYQQSTFTHHDLAKFINRHTLDAEQFERVYEKVKADEEIVSLGLDEKGRERFTTHQMLNTEKRMLENTVELYEKHTHKVSKNAYLSGLENRHLSDEQNEAYDHLLTSGDLSCVVGYAGTGKSYLLGAAKEAWEAQGYNVKGVTLAGIAAENLEASSGIESRTLASRQYYWDRGDELLSDKDILVVDEAGMFGSRQMDRLLSEAQRGNAKVVLIGDPQQLQAIEAGAAFRAVSVKTGYTELTEIRRQQEGWQRNATKAFAENKISEGLNAYEKRDCVHEFETQAMAKKGLVESWNDARISSPDKTQIMLAYTRKDVQDLNAMARELKKNLGELGREQALSTSKGEKPFAENDRIYFLQNDRKLGVKNGTLGTIEKIDGNQVTVKLDKEHLNQHEKSKSVEINLNEYNHIDYGYAGTIHKSQGTTVDRSYVLASKQVNSHALYVAMSRHREGAELYWSKEEFAHKSNLERTMSRQNLKDVTLDYSEVRKQFADNRGIEVSSSLLKVKENAQDLKHLHNEKQANKSSSLSEFGFSSEEIEKFNKINFKESFKQKDEFSNFKQKFEKDNPSFAESLSYEIQPDSEKRALTIQQVFGQLNEQLAKNPRNYEFKQDLSKAAVIAAQDKKAMHHIKQEAPELSKQIDSLAKQHEKEKDLGWELEL